ncbi:MAG: hypothetical protein DMF60_11180 [Acidobacteria bacterium]|nr:MAG: hypothetical protein DMF60_11180 [Acidobacteriota bacterium]
MSISNITSSDYEPMLRPYSIGPMQERDLIDVVEIEETSGLNRWGYDAYRRELFTNPNSIMIVARNSCLASGLSEDWRRTELDGGGYG